MPIRFAGYAAIFDRVDKGGDIIRRGAFGALGPGKRLPLLWQHRAQERIGWITHASEDARGLRVIGEITGERAARHVREGSVRGLSFGYRATRTAGAAPRELLTLDVAEISLVTHPMQPAARVHFLTASN